MTGRKDVIRGGRNAVSQAAPVICRGIRMRKNYVIMMRELREDHDLRQKEVAAYLKIDQRVYSRYETGRNALPIEKAISLCELYHVSADYFLGLDTVKRRR